MLVSYYQVKQRDDTCLISSITTHVSKHTVTHTGIQSCWRPIRLEKIMCITY